MDSSALYMRALTSWQIVAVCLFLMCLLPLVFYNVFFMLTLIACTGFGSGHGPWLFEGPHHQPHV